MENIESYKEVKAKFLIFSLIKKSLIRYHTVYTTDKILVVI